MPRWALSVAGRGRPCARAGGSQPGDVGIGRRLRFPVSGLFLTGNRTTGPLTTPRLNSAARGASIRPPLAREQPIREERHGQGSDAQQQGKEEAEGRMEQEEERRPRPLALRFGAGATPARPEPVRQEELSRPTGTASPYSAAVILSAAEWWA